MSNANDVSVHDAEQCLRRLAQGYKNVPAAVVLPSTACVLHRKTPNEQRYVKTKIAGSRQRAEYYIHHLVLRSKDVLLRDSMQVSHLCHNKRCINPDHIVLETGEANRHRQMCTQRTLLLHVCSCCSHREWINPCPHVPQCVVPKP